MSALTPGEITILRRLAGEPIKGLPTSALNPRAGRLRPLEQAGLIRWADPTWEITEEGTSALNLEEMRA